MILSTDSKRIQFAYLSMLSKTILGKEARKEAVNIGILLTSRNGGRKIMQFIQITSRPPLRIRKWKQLSQF